MLGPDLAQSQWRKSSFSGVNGCVECAVTSDGWIAIRDSKNPDAGVQRYNRLEWEAFLAGVHNGEFDYPLN
jgi:hypothetical protein